MKVIIKSLHFNVCFSEYKWDDVITAAEAAAFTHESAVIVNISTYMAQYDKNKCANCLCVFLF